MGSFLNRLLVLPCSTTSQIQNLIEGGFSKGIENPVWVAASQLLNISVKVARIPPFCE